ncbi:MAG: DUF3408 domain-containing protein [Rikenellaceae bacterium]
MSNREKPEIDETMMQDMVSRGVQHSGNTSAQTTHNPQVDQPPNGELKRRQQRDKSAEYIEKYLPRVDFDARQLIYVSKETHAALTSIVQIVGGHKANISSYVEHIINTHLESHKDIINGLYANKFNPPVK